MTSPIAFVLNGAPVVVDADLERGESLLNVLRAEILARIAKRITVDRDEVHDTIHRPADSSPLAPAVETPVKLPLARAPGGAAA